MTGDTPGFTTSGRGVSASDELDALTELTELTELSELSELSESTSATLTIGFTATISNGGTPSSTGPVADDFVQHVPIFNLCSS